MRQSRDAKIPEKDIEKQGKIGQPRSETHGKPRVDVLAHPLPFGACELLYVDKVDQPGFIYFIQAAKRGLIKIGFTGGGPMGRFGTVQTHSPLRVYMVGVVNGSLRREREFHERFWHAHHHGEWFRPVPDLVRYIRVHRLPEIPGHPNAPGSPSVAYERLPRIGKRYAGDERFNRRYELAMVRIADSPSLQAGWSIFESDEQVCGPDHIDTVVEWFKTTHPDMPLYASPRLNRKWISLKYAPVAMSP